MTLGLTKHEYPGFKAKNSLSLKILAVYFLHTIMTNISNDFNNVKTLKAGNC